MGSRSEVSQEVTPGRTDHPAPGSGVSTQVASLAALVVQRSRVGSRGVINLVTPAGSDSPGTRNQGLEFGAIDAADAPSGRAACHASRRVTVKKSSATLRLTGISACAWGDSGDDDRSSPESTSTEIRFFDGDRK